MPRQDWQRAITHVDTKENEALESEARRRGVTRSFLIYSTLQYATKGFKDFSRIPSARGRGYVLRTKKEIENAS